MLGGECSECCGWWVCCPVDSCAVSDHISDISVTISSQDFYLRRFSTFNGSTLLSSGFRGSLFSGNYSLPKVSGANIWQLVDTTAELYELTVSVTPTTPCCKSFVWSLSLGWKIYASFGPSVSTPEMLWSTTPQYRYAIGEGGGTSPRCIAPISSSDSGTFEAMPYNTDGGAGVELIGTNTVSFSVAIT